MNKDFKKTNSEYFTLESLKMNNLLKVIKNTYSLLSMS